MGELKGLDRGQCYLSTKKQGGWVKEDRRVTGMRGGIQGGEGLNASPKRFQPGEGGEKLDQRGGKAIHDSSYRNSRGKVAGQTSQEGEEIQERTGKTPTGTGHRPGKWTIQKKDAGLIISKKGEKG